MDNHSLMVYIGAAVLISIFVSLFWSLSRICKCIKCQKTFLSCCCQRENGPDQDQDQDQDQKKFDETNYSEALNSYRHYSNLRFVMLTLFSGATAYLMQAFFDTDIDVENAKFVITKIGMGLTIIFFTIELTLDTIQTHIARYSVRENANSHLRTPCFISLLTELVRIPILSIYALVLWAWVSFGTCPLEMDASEECLIPAVTSSTSQGSG